MVLNIEPLAPMRVGCVACDTRPESYFRATGYHRGEIWHFSTGDEEKFEATWASHREHGGSWALLVTL
jgi:hypothetical protein